MGSLQNSTGSIEALKALFESKAAMQNKVKSSFRVPNATSHYKTADVSVMNGEAAELKNTIEEPKTQKCADVVDAKSNAKMDHMTRKVNKNKHKDNSLVSCSESSSFLSL